MTKKIIKTAPIYSNGEKVGTYHSITYAPMTTQEMNIRFAAMTVIAVAISLIVQSVI
jgi:hypothetical protein